MTVNLRRNTPLLLAAFAAVIGLVFTLSQVLPIGADFYSWYYLVPQAWWAGDTRLYDDASRGFFLPPWGLWPYLLPSLLSPELAMAAVTAPAITIVAFVAFRSSMAPVAQPPSAVRGAGEGAYPTSSRTPLIVAMLAAACPYSLVLYLTGTPDAWSLLGLYLAWEASLRRRGILFGSGVMLALVRPQNCLLAVPLLIVGLGSWTRTQRLRAAVPALLVLAGSVATSGWDWPVRWWQNYFISRPSPNGVTTVYTVLEQAGVPVIAAGAMGFLLGAGVLLRMWYNWTGQARAPALHFALALNAALAPFMRSPGYVIPLATAWAALASRRPLLAAAPYLISIPTVLVAVSWADMWALWKALPVIDLAFPAVLSVTLLLENVAGARPSTGSGRAGQTPTGDATTNLPETEGPSPAHAEPVEA
jgi:hypothetical protein